MKYNNKNGKSYYLATDIKQENVYVIWAIADHYHIYPKDYKRYGMVMEISQTNYKKAQTQ